MLKIHTIKFAQRENRTFFLPPRKKKNQISIQLFIFSLFVNLHNAHRHWKRSTRRITPAPDMILCDKQCFFLPQPEKKKLYCMKLSEMLRVSEHPRNVPAARDVRSTLIHEETKADSYDSARFTTSGQQREQKQHIYRYLFLVRYLPTLSRGSFQLSFQLCLGLSCSSRRTL